MRRSSVFWLNVFRRSSVHFSFVQFEEPSIHFCVHLNKHLVKRLICGRTIYWLKLKGIFLWLQFGEWKRTVHLIGFWFFFFKFPDGQRYWSKPETSPSMVVEEDAHCHAFCRADSSAVEMTSYVLLAYMNRDEPTADVLVQTMPMVKWLNTQRNALGGFSSTQVRGWILYPTSEYSIARIGHDSTIIPPWRGNGNCSTSNGCILDITVTIQNYR